MVARWIDVGTLVVRRLVEDVEDDRQGQKGLNHRYIKKEKRGNSDRVLRRIKRHKRCSFDDGRDN